MPNADILIENNTAAPLPPSERREVRLARLLATVGQRVLNARKQANLSRRELFEISGVSQRYIAQLESGQGNISIGLLLRLADAFGHNIETLVADPPPCPPGLSSIMASLPSATQDQINRIAAILDPAKPGTKRANRIAFIGLRGAGKSTLGRLAADHLNLPLIEINEDIEQASGMAVTEVMELYGPEGYRHLERQALERVAATHERIILGVAGGIVSDRESFDYLLDNYHAIWLKAAPEEHMARVRAQGDERPMAGSPDAMAELRNILTNREAQYARASACVDTSNRTHNESLRDVLTIISDNAFLHDLTTR